MTNNNKIQVKKVDVLGIKGRLTLAALLVVTIMFIIRYLDWWFQSEHIPSNWKNSPLQFLDYLLFSILSFVIFLGTFLKLGTWFAIWHMAKPKYIAPRDGIKVAFVTCYVPGSEPVEMLRKTLIAMKNVRYPHDTWVLDEGNSPEVIELTKEIGVYHFSRKDVEIYNQQHGKFKIKTKAGNLNSWQHAHGDEYEIVAQIDMDNIPHPDILIRTIGYFDDKSIGFVGIPQVYGNTHNWISKGASEQTHLFYGPVQQGFYGCNMPFLIGNAHIYRSEALKSMDGYVSHISEDHITGLHFYSNKWKGVYVSENLAEGEGPLTWQDYFNQQLRWSYGLFDVLFKHSYKHFPKMPWKQRINYFFAQLFYFTGIASSLGFLLITLYFIFGINTANMDLNEWLNYFLPPFILSHIIHVYIHKYYINPKKEPIFGFLGMFLGQAANLIYTFAFIQFILGKKLTYVVTPKGENQNKVDNSMIIFRPFVIMLYITTISLIFGIYFNRDSIVMNFWAIHNIFMLSAIITSDSLANALMSIKSKLSNKLFTSKVIVSSIFVIINAGIFYTLLDFITRKTPQLIATLSVVKTP